GRQIYARGAVVGEGGQVVAIVGGGDGHDVRQVVARGVERVLIVVLADAQEVAVARGRHVDMPRIGGILNRVVKSLGIGIAAVAVIRDLGAVGDGVVQGENGVARGARALRIEELQGHDADVPVDAGD